MCAKGASSLQIAKALNADKIIIPVSYKNHRKYIRDESKWITVENAFEPIISLEL
ncbi:MAG: recombinase family protein [Ruminococcus sp.]|nr:recombinase family protein [Ruminococcus sp.]